MTPEIKIIHQLCVNEIFQINSTSEKDTKAWIANKDYILNSPLTIKTNSQSDEFILETRNLEGYHIALTNECNRFSQAAIESMWAIHRVDKLPKSIAWTAVQIYYSAFFTAHALLRLFGRSCVQLEYPHVKSVFDVASVTSMNGTATSIQSGFYSSSLENGVIHFIKLKDSHADTWHSFYLLLNWIIENVSNTTSLVAQQIKTVDLITRLKNSISQSGASRGNWLSQIRNSINYQHTHGVWHPYKGATHAPEKIIINNNWTKDPASFELDSRISEIDSLFNTANAMLSLHYHLIKYGYERSGMSSKPLKNGTFKLINIIQAA